MADINADDPRALAEAWKAVLASASDAIEKVIAVIGKPADTHIWKKTAVEDVFAKTRDYFCRDPRPLKDQTEAPDEDDLRICIAGFWNAPSTLEMILKKYKKETMLPDFLLRDTRLTRGTAAQTKLLDIVQDLVTTYQLSIDFCMRDLTGGKFATSSWDERVRMVTVMYGARGSLWPSGGNNEAYRKVVGLNLADLPGFVGNGVDGIKLEDRARLLLNVIAGMASQQVQLSRENQNKKVANAQETADVARLAAQALSRDIHNMQSVSNYDRQNLGLLIDDVDDLKVVVNRIVAKAPDADTKELIREACEAAMQKHFQALQAERGDRDAWLAELEETTSAQAKRLEQEYKRLCEEAKEATKAAAKSMDEQLKKKQDDYYKKVDDYFARKKEAWEKWFEKLMEEHQPEKKKSRKESKN